jgi:glycosyltransferase involved in cell wall biosynthesis
VHDIFPLDHPEWFTCRFAAFYEFLLPRLLHRVEHVVAVSSYTKSRLMARLRVPEKKITVIPNGVGTEFSPRSDREIHALRSRLGIPAGPYVLSVGSLEPRKNLSSLLQAWTRVSATHPECTLVLAGGSGRCAVFRKTELPKTSKVMFTGYLPDTDLPSLYSGATCFVYPSLAEGFGLPILEALACGTPVVASNASAIPEIAGVDTVLVDPRSAPEMVNAICRVIESADADRARVSARQAHARQYSWQRCAQKTERLLLSHC